MYLRLVDLCITYLSAESNKEEEEETAEFEGACVNMCREAGERRERERTGSTRHSRCTPPYSGLYRGM